MIIVQCKESYGAKLNRTADRCPNLVLSDEPMVDGAYSLYNLEVFYEDKKIRTTSPSLADLWSTWNQEYVESDTPRLIIRYEDVLFHAEKVMSLISDCTGVPLSRPGEYMYRAKKAKAHGKSTDLAMALRMYGSEEGRYGSMSPEDVSYSRTALSPDLMNLFGYSHAPENYKDFYSAEQDPKVYRSAYAGTPKKTLPPPKRVWRVGGGVRPSYQTTGLASKPPPSTQSLP